MPSTIRPEIIFQSGSGETKFYNNLVYVESGGNPIFTSLASQGVQYDISHNLFYPYSAFSLANELTDNALFLNPKLRNPGSSSASMYKLLTGSNAKYAGAIINTSINPFDYSNNNGGLDYFGNAVSDSTAPHIGAYNANELLASYVGVDEVEIPTLTILLSIILSIIMMAIFLINKKDCQP